MRDTRWIIYEQEKAKLQAMGLSQAEYERRIRELLERLKL
jgi:hypothetical protein